MDFHEAINGLTCRLCLCKCENARNLLEEIELAAKIMQIFPKVEISPKNSFPTLICDYCHNLVQQFYGYFETVNANQEELMKMLTEITKVVVFAEPILDIEEKMDIDEPKMDSDSDNNDDNFYDDAESPPMVVIPTPKPPNRKKTDFTKEELLQMDYFQLQKLPLNFKYFFRCPLCSTTDRFQCFSSLTAHICVQHFGHLKVAKRKPAVERKMDSLNLRLFCDICEYSLPKYKFSEQFQDHKFFHYDIRPYKCDICGCSVRTKSGILEHIKSHLRRIEKLGCLICTENFDTTELKDDHLRKCHPGAFFACEKCHLKFVDDVSLQKHVKNEHIFVIECPRCPAGIRFPNENVLALHQQQHLKEDKVKKKFACKLCERKFNGEKMAKVHLKQHKENRVKACKICGKTISLAPNEKENRKHMKEHLREKPESFKCDKCGADFPSKATIALHIRFNHTEKEACHICGKLIKPGFMTTHLKNCVGGDFKCIHCPMVFKTKSVRGRHTRDAHLGYKCHRCDIRFQTEGELRFHCRHGANHKNTYKKPTKNKRNKVAKNKTEIKQ